MMWKQNGNENPLRRGKHAQAELFTAARQSLDVGKEAFEQFF
jgi:hypothetical protein